MFDMYLYHKVLNISSWHVDFACSVQRVIIYTVIELLPLARRRLSKQVVRYRERVSRYLSGKYNYLLWMFSAYQSTCLTFNDLYDLHIKMIISRREYFAFISIFRLLQENITEIAKILQNKIARRSEDREFLFDISGTDFFNIAWFRIAHCELVLQYNISIIFWIEMRARNNIRMAELNDSKSWYESTSDTYKKSLRS